MAFQKAAQAVAALLSSGGGGGAGGGSLHTAMRLHHIECDSPLSDRLGGGVVPARGAEPALTTGQFKPCPNAEPRPTRVDAPAYGWTCHVCEGSNLAGQAACMACGAAPSLSMAEVVAAKERLGRSLPPFQDTSHGRT